MNRPPGLTDDDRLAEAEEAITMRDALIAGLAGAASELSQVARELAVASVLSRVQRIVFSVVVFLSFIGTVASVLGVGLLLHNQQANNEQRDRIVSCTTPEGACYQRAQAQTEDAVGKLSQLVLATAECNDSRPVGETLSACVSRRLKQ